MQVVNWLIDNIFINAATILGVVAFIGLLIQK